MGTLDQDNPNSAKSDHAKYVYFQPGQIIFIVTHTGNDLSQKDLDALIAWSDKTAVEKDLNLTVLPRAREELLSFPAMSEEDLGPLRQQEAQPPQDDRYRAPRVEQLERHNPFTIVLADVKNRGDPAKYVNSARLSDFITQLDESILLKENPNRPNLTSGTVLQVVSPNWLSSPSSETGGGGGPGSRPVPFSGNNNNPPDEPQYEFHLPEEIVPLCPPNEDRGKDVIVAILDTAPCLHDLVAAYERWQKVDPQPNIQEKYPGNPPKPHGLIESLLKPGGPLTVHPASYEELLRMRSVHLKDHNYDMTDHGLFVASIVHSIAPAAEIHLYEVLNSEGVGDLKSIALGLWKVWKAFPTQPLVVNCSLVLNIPLLNHPITDLDKKLKAKIIHKWDEHKNKAETINRLSDELWSEEESLVWLARQALAIRWICDLIYVRNSRVIAAAGNDHEPGRPDSERPQARYPAAFESVVGVGALKKRVHRNDPLGRAEYSDRSDEPEETGIMTLGGEKGKENGVLGVYLGKFPHETDDDKPGPKNGYDWAWWAGTSFASPIISGMAAAVLSGNPGFTTERAIQALYQAQVITIGPWGEDVLEVMQGPPLL